jgi:heme O synthase-like polyprenyltransferase
MTVMDVVITVDVVTGVPAAGGTGVTGGACAGLAPPSANPAPMRLFHLSIAYLTLLFAVIAVTALLPWGSW